MVVSMKAVERDGFVLAGMKGSVTRKFCLDRRGYG